MGAAVISPVSWLPRASDKVEKSLIRRLTAELRSVFPRSRMIVVYDCFGGYSHNHAEKIVLGVEVRSGEAYHTHVVKIGSRGSVAPDYDGWRMCVQQRNFASRILVSLSRKTLPHGRAAIIYQDAHRFFGTPEEGQGPVSLEKAVFDAVLTNRPAAISVERVIRQVFNDLSRWFYRASGHSSATAVSFHRARLRRAIGPWNTEPWRRDLRRDLIWLLCGGEAPDAATCRRYLDPCDYIEWALRNRHVPQTLVGRSHGDLHGRNIHVGIQREEAEYPALFDYGEMSDRNVTVWDFVKLETELKVRLLLPLFQNVEARRRIFDLAAAADRRVLVEEDAGKPTAEIEVRSLRLGQLAFAFHFEDTLAGLTDRLHQLCGPESPDPPEEGK